MDKEVKSADSTSKVGQPESDFTEFFYGIISKLYDLKCRQISNDVKTALKNMRSLKPEDQKLSKIFFSYKVPSVRCAYMYAYSVLHTLMVYSEFSNLVDQNKKFLRPTLSKHSLKICCIGGGPGTEAVAICKSINDFIFKPSTENNESVLEVSITVIDKLPHWKREESAIINAANDESNLLHSKRIILQSDFMKADLLKPFETNLQEKIREADIVTVVKFGSHIQEKSPDECNMELRNMMRNVIDSMNENSCLFMLDKSGGKVFYGMKRVLCENRSSFRLKTSAHKEYCLDQRTVKKLGELMVYRKTSSYHPILPTGKGKVSSCLWIKNVTQASENTKDSIGDDEVQGKSSENTQSSFSKSKGDKKLKKKKGVIKTEINKAEHDVLGKEKLQGSKKSSKKRKEKLKPKPVLNLNETQIPFESESQTFPSNP